MPLPPRHFTVYFKFESEELTDQSRALMRDVLQAVKERPAPDVAVVGHTDTRGKHEANVALGLRRANTVRMLLVETGVDDMAIEAASHGEAQLLVPTRDNVYEPRNRRVEISVR
jgi:outer membrane protein OmpA-like peptidoglycan-associated protein